jgi:outer membrane protein, multidrug efflux system
MMRYVLLGMSLVVMGLGSGCMVGPDYQRPTSAVDDVNHFSWLPEDWEDVNEPNGIGAWWKDFNDPVLNALVERALENNPDLLGAVAAVERSRALLAQAHGVRLPEAGYSGNKTRTRVSFDFPPAGGRFSFISQTYTHGIQIGYVTDLFGRLRRSERAAYRELMASDADRETLVHTVIANVVLTRIQIATQQDLLRIAEATIQNWQQGLEIIEERYEGGVASPLDVYFAKQSLVSAQSLKTRLKQGLVLQLHALDALCGQVPETTKELSETSVSLPVLAAFPMGQPADLLDRRPDVRAAEMRLAAATERIGVSIAQMYPDLTLTATGGIDGSTSRDISNIHNRVYSFAFGVTAPIFMGGRLKAGVRAARAGAEQAVSHYAGVVLQAFHEVEDALVSEQLLAQRLIQLEEALKLALEAEQLARERYKGGVDPMLVVLETERKRRLAENELALVQGQQWEARVQLFLSLGGTWTEPDKEQDS